MGYCFRTLSRFESNLSLVYQWAYSQKEMGHSDLKAAKKETGNTIQKANFNCLFNHLDTFDEIKFNKFNFIENNFQILNLLFDFNLNFLKMRAPLKVYKN